MIESALGSQGTLAIVAARVDGPEGALDRALDLLPHWAGPVVILLVGDAEDAGDTTGVPENVEIIAAGGTVAEALSSRLPESMNAVARTLLQAASVRVPVTRVLFVASEPVLDLLPAFAEGAFPRPLDVELPESAGVPDPEWLWQNADSLLVPDYDRQYVLSTGQPALPVRVVPRAAGDAAAIAALPAVGGPPRVSVVAPVRGNPELALRMAASVLARTPGLLELILIEDASPDGTLQRLEKLAGRDARVRLFAHGEQHGFAASCNRGLMAARGDLVLALNADTVVTPGWAERLGRHLALQSNAGIVGPLSNRVSGLQQLAPVDYDERTLAGLEHFSEQLGRAAQGAARGVVRLAGLCLAISRPALRRTGGFDPRFFPGYFEDDDYCLRLIAGGLLPYRADDTFVHHEGARSLQLEPRADSALREENWARFKRKWNLPEDRPLERNYSPEELRLQPYVREAHFIAPWKALEPVRTE